MPRCQICNFCDTTLSSNLDLVSTYSESGNKVRYYPKEDKEICDNCKMYVKTNQRTYFYDQLDKDLVAEWEAKLEEETEDIEPDDPICEDTPALSEV